MRSASSGYSGCSGSLLDDPHRHLLNIATGDDVRFITRAEIKLHGFVHLVLGACWALRSLDSRAHDARCILQSAWCLVLCYHLGSLSALHIESGVIDSQLAVR